MTEIDVIAHARVTAPLKRGRLTAPMPGKLVSFLAAGGRYGHQGPAACGDGGYEDGAHHQCAPRDGVVAELLFAVGDQIGDGAELWRLEA